MRIPYAIFNSRNLWSSFSTIFDIENELPPPHCPIDLPSTCRNSTIIPDTCCFEYPGGVFLQSQFWNYKPSRPDLNSTQIVSELGPLDSFTIHGLWPDNCDGSFEQFCSHELFIDNVYNLLHSGVFQDSEKLFDDMDLLWKSNVVGQDESLWIHEFNKHGSCIKNLYSECYKRWGLESKISGVDNDENYWNQRGVIDYFNTSVTLFKGLDTFKILKKHNIVPSIGKTYSKDEIEEALKGEFNNQEVFINCDGNNVINEIWYYHLLQGSFLNSNFIPISVNDLGSRKPSSRCRPDGIKYYPKGYFPKGSNPNPPNGRRGRIGTLRLTHTESQDNAGFIIKNGHWMTKDTPANFELIKSPFGNYNLKSRLGYCAIDTDSEFSCHYKNIQEASQFEYDEEAHLIGYSNNNQWGSDIKPKDTKQSKLFITNDNDELNYKYKLQMKFIAL